MCCPLRQTASADGRQRGGVGLDLRPHAPQAERLERAGGQLRQETRSQQFRLEDAHATSVLGIAIFEETAELESVEEHADLSSGKVLAVVQLLAAIRQPGHTTQRPQVVTQ